MIANEAVIFAVLNNSLTKITSMLLADSEAALVHYVKLETDWLRANLQNTPYPSIRCVWNRQVLQLRSGTKHVKFDEVFTLLPPNNSFKERLKIASNVKQLISSYQAINCKFNG